MTVDKLATKVKNNKKWIDELEIRIENMKKIQEGMNWLYAFKQIKHYVYDFFLTYFKKSPFQITKCYKNNSIQIFWITKKEKIKYLVYILDQTNVPKISRKILSLEFKKFSPRAI